MNEDYINKMYDNYIEDYLTKILNEHKRPAYKKPEKTQVEKDEEILDNMDIKTIENYLRKKKLQNLPKSE
jgi:hypothetical protein